MAVSLTTSLGEMRIVLHTAEAPASTRNFAELVRAGYFDGCALAVRPCCDPEGRFGVMGRRSALLTSRCAAYSSSVRVMSSLAIRSMAGRRQTPRP